MIIASITLDQAERAAYALQTEGGHDEAADALFALTNDTDVLVTSDGTSDADTLRVLKASPEHMLRALRAIKARINGVWDDPDLISFGPLGNMNEDILAIIAKAEGRAHG